MHRLSVTQLSHVLLQLIAKRDERQNVPKIQLLTIWLGANDATFPGEQQHAPLDLFKANLSKMIHLVRDPDSEWYSPETRIILIAPPPVNAAQWLQFLRTEAANPRDTVDRSLEGSKIYANAVKEVATQEQVPVVDLWTLFWEAAGEKEDNLPDLLSDGLHLNERGFKVRSYIKLTL